MTVTVGRTARWSRRVCGLALALVLGVLPIAALAANAPAPTGPAATAPVVATPVAALAPVPAPHEAVSSDANAKINPGDTAWMLASTALVLMMTIPGLALYYAGMVRKKNVLDTLAQSFIVTCLVTVLWYVIGYSLAFTNGNPWIGGLSRVFLQGMNKDTVTALSAAVPESVYMTFQMTFAIITPALIAGSFAERMKFSALLWFMSLWLVFVYAPVAHWVWSSDGWLAQLGALDFAGGTVVHLNSGVAGLVAALVLGKRKGYGREAMPPHNLVLTVIGAALLWVGWFGFNAGSAVSAGGRAGMAMATTQIATAAAALSWMFAEWMARGRPSVLGMVSGAVAGLVAITPASGFVDPTGAFMIGIAGGVVCFWTATYMKNFFGYDDALDAFGVHAIGGALGAILTGVFAVKAIGGTAGALEGNDYQVVKQLIDVGSVLLYDAVVTYVILKVIDVLVGLRVSEEDEVQGLDLSQHGEQVYE
ncbi:ammonium transporter [Acidiferrobacter sp.]|uniref:ammonium transporter n=1 Tax=Acidiferrobacter sp. TaxID=1872107 RepID=UPI0026220986|nr:ammonium transporter [Acidiferrobacter sp.]